MAEQGDPRLDAPTAPEALRAAADAVRRQVAEHLPDVALGLVAAVCVAAVGWLCAVAITVAVWMPTAPADGTVATPLHVGSQLWLAAHHVLLRTPDGLFGLTPLGFTLLPATALILAGRYIGHRLAARPARPAAGSPAGTGPDPSEDFDADGFTRFDYAGEDSQGDVDTYFDESWGRGPGAEPETGPDAAFSRSPYDVTVRTGRLSGPAGPARFGRGAGTFDPSVLWLLGAAVLGYELCAELIAWSAAAGTLRADLGGCVSYPPLLAAAGFGAGFLSVRPPRLGRRAAAAVRAATAATAVLVCGGAALAVLALALRFGQVGATGHSLGGGTAADVGLFLIDLALLPNLIGWAVSFLVGPGFAVGAGSRVWMFGSAHGPLPSLPVLGAIPVPGPLSAWLLAAGLVPVLAGAGATVLVVRLVRSWPDRLAALAAAAAATGLGCGLFSALSGGPVADGAMAVTGPAGWQVGLAAGGLIGAVGLAGLGLVALAAAAGTKPVGEVADEVDAGALGADPQTAGERESAGEDAGGTSEDGREPGVGAGTPRRGSRLAAGFRLSGRRGARPGRTADEPQPEAADAGEACVSESGDAEFRFPAVPLPVFPLSPDPVDLGLARPEPGSDPGPDSAAPAAPATPAHPGAADAADLPEHPAPAEDPDLPGPAPAAPAASTAVPEPGEPAPHAPARTGSVPDDQGAAEPVGEGLVVPVPERGEEPGRERQAVDQVGQRPDEGRAETGGLQAALPDHQDPGGLLAQGLPGGALPVELPQAGREDPGEAQQHDEDPGAGRPAQGDHVPGRVVGGRLDALEQGGHPADEQGADDQEVEQGGPDPQAPGGQVDV
ncbi:MAG TPA: DUF6350 family protein [Actinocrinis sp.]|nr:DUF6350 family protein [Actinocrinis sp.]